MSGPSAANTHSTSTPLLRADFASVPSTSIPAVPIFLLCSANQLNHLPSRRHCHCLTSTYLQCNKGRLTSMFPRSKLRVAEKWRWGKGKSHPSIYLFHFLLSIPGRSSEWDGAQQCRQLLDRLSWQNHPNSRRRQPDTSNWSGAEEANCQAEENLPGTGDFALAECFTSTREHCQIVVQSESAQNREEAGWGWGRLREFSPRICTTKRYKNNFRSITHWFSIWCNKRLAQSNDKFSRVEMYWISSYMLGKFSQDWTI